MDSDGSHIFVPMTIILAVLLCVRMLLAFGMAACTKINDGKVKSFENEKGCRGVLFKLMRSPSRLINSFYAHKLLSDVLISAACCFAFVLPVISRAAKDCSAESAVKTAALLAGGLYVGAVIVGAVFDRLPEKLMKGERADSFAVFIAPAMRMMCVFMTPFTVPAEAAAGAAAAVLGLDTEGSDETVTEEEILLMVDAGNETGSIESSEREMINNVFEFHEMTVSEVMTHRTDMVAVSIDAEISEVVITAINSGFSRIPVYSGSVDHIEGILYVKDLLCLISTQSAEGITVKSFLRDVEFVPESCSCDELFRTLTAGRLQLAVVVDEYGGTAGLVTMEDLVEAIFGNIQDEYDNETEDMSRISDNVYTVSGTANAADIMEKLGCPLPEDSEYDTMGGFVTDLLGSIPEDGETPSAEYENITFTVLVAEDMRIVRLKAVINDDKQTEKENQQNDE